MKRASSSPTAGFFHFGIIRLFLPIVFFWIGGQQLYTALTNRQPHAVTFAEYARTKPDHKWLELKETRLDLLEAVYFGYGDSISEIYIPMHAPDDPEDAKTVALLLTKDTATIDLVKKMKAALQGDDKAKMDFMKANADKLFPQRTVRGLVQFGIDSNDKRRRKIVKLDKNLASEFAVIEEGKEPGLLVGAAFFLAAFPITWLCWLRRSTPKTATPPPLPG